MKTIEPKTKAIFRVFPGGDVIALFPAEAATVGNPYHCLSYQHMGQHGAADPLLMVQMCRPAKPAEYCDLASELRRRGYKLDIRQRITRADLEARKEQLKR